MARKSRKNTPIAVAEPTDNLTTKAVLSLDKEAKPYQVGIYARLSFESEANKERDTVDTQIAYIREFINGQDDMVEVCVYADISVTGTTFERPEFDRMIHDIRAGKINTVITRDLSRLGRNYVEAGNYIERVFPFLDVRYIAITDDFDTARPGTDLSVPFKNIVNEYYSKDLSKKVETGKHSIWAQGGFSEGTPPYGYYRATDGSRKLLIDEEVSDNVVRIFNMFLDGKGYAGIAKTLQYEGILSPPKYRFYKSGKIELAEKAREWHYSHVKEILQGEYYIGNIVHGKQRKALDTGRKNVKTDASTWQRIENVHEPIIDKDTFYKTRERMEHIKKKHLEASKPKADVPNKPDNILVYKTKCACCGGSVLIGRHHTYSEKFYYKCKNRRKLARLCENKYSYDYSEVMDSVFSVIRQHMSLCVEKTKFVQKMNSRKENVLQYDIYTKQIAKLQNDVRRITANKSGLYEDYIQVIITKDYSRLGRDYLEVGRYLEFVFPVLKVRYISVNDNYDSNNFTGATGGMEVAVKNVINMMYSRDASKKVRSARTTLAKAGKFIGPQAPYGYKRSESDKQKLVIDEEPAELLSKMETFDLDLIRQVVKRITMYDDGNIQFEWNVDDFLQVK